VTVNRRMQQDNEGEELRRLFAGLLEAQEAERAEIARELHDDIGASLAVLGIELLSGGQAGAGPQEPTSEGIARICEELQAVARRVSRLSHRLHPPALEYLGLAKAIQIECREVSEQGGIAAVCSCRGVPSKVDLQLARNFFRVAQEAVQNAARHSGAAKVEVELTACPETLTLVVRDEGRGFDVAQSRLSPGLGLPCMRERMRMIGGDFEVGSRPGHGTRIKCCAPFKPATSGSS